VKGIDAMKNKAAIGLMFLLVFLAVSSGKGQTSEQYVSIQSIELHQKENGTDGTVQVLVDRRLSADSIREKFWGHGPWELNLDEESDLYKNFSDRPPLNAKVRIQDESGKIFAERRLEHPLAKLEPWNPDSVINQLFLLTEDYSAGFGSYNGPITSLIQIFDESFHDVNALNAQSHKEEPIEFMKSLKTDWQIVRRDGKVEILKVACRPNFDDTSYAGSFVIIYTRFSFDGRRWFKNVREEAGYWEEGDDPFPDRSQFP
jgi:hypothetical protein